MCLYNLLAIPEREVFLLQMFQLKLNQSYPCHQLKFITDALRFRHKQDCTKAAEFHQSVASDMNPGAGNHRCEGEMNGVLHEGVIAMWLQPRKSSGCEKKKNPFISLCWWKNAAGRDPSVNWSSHIWSKETCQLDPHPLRKIKHIHQTWQNESKQAHLWCFETKTTWFPCQSHRFPFAFSLLLIYLTKWPYVDTAWQLNANPLFTV